jgi:hypothetical protein
MGFSFFNRVATRWGIYLFCLAFLFFICEVSVWAWPQPNGLELAKKPGAQKNPVLAPGLSGTWFAAWLDESGGVPQVYAQLINDNGTPLWNSNGVLAGYSLSSQAEPALCPDGNGGAYLAWTDYRQGAALPMIYAQHLNSEGSTLWTQAGTSVCSQGYLQSAPSLLPDGEGGVFVAWVDKRNGNFDIYAQRLNSVGTTLWNKAGIPVIKYSGDQTELKIAAGINGGFYAVWSDTRSGNKDIYLQKISKEGTLGFASSGFSVCAQALIQQHPSLISDTEGNAYITWEDGRKGFFDIYAQRVAVAGTASWTLQGLAICTAASQQYSPVETLSSPSTLVLAWTDRRAGDYKVYLQCLDTAGNLLWQENGKPLSSLTTYQDSPQIAPDGMGGFYLGWLDSRAGNIDLYAQRFTNEGVACWQAEGIPVAAASGDVETPVLLPDSGVGLLLAWGDYRNSTAPDIYIQKIPFSGRLESGIEPKLFEIFGQ